jgi:uncharacterized integral membrane protein
MSDQVRPTTGRRVGYTIAIIVNGVMLIIVNNLLEWGWFSWLTDDFEQVLPIVNLSLIASILVNLAYLVYDAEWFKTVSDTGLLVISIVVAMRTWQVFPFDFSAYSWDWEATTRMIIAFAILGMGIAVIVNIVRLIAMGARTSSKHLHA